MPAPRVANFLAPSWQYPPCRCLSRELLWGPGPSRIARELSRPTLHRVFSRPVGSSCECRLLRRAEGFLPLRPGDPCSVPMTEFEATGSIVAYFSMEICLEQSI